MEAKKLDHSRKGQIVLLDTVLSTLGNAMLFVEITIAQETMSDVPAHDCVKPKLKKNRDGRDYASYTLANRMLGVAM